MPDRSRAVPLHDGQDDAMPCECPACNSPFVTNRRPHRLPDVPPAAQLPPAIHAPGRSSTVPA